MRRSLSLFHSSLLDTHVDLADEPDGEEDSDETTEDGQGFAKRGEEGVVVDNLRKNIQSALHFGMVCVLLRWIMDVDYGYMW